MRNLGQAGMAAGAVDDDEIGHRLHRRDGGGQAQVERVLALRQVGGIHLGQVAVVGGRQRQPGAGKIGAAVLDIAAKAFLPQVKVQRTDTVAHPHQGGRHMHAGGGLARSALFVPDNDDMRHDRPRAPHWSIRACY